MNEQNTNEEEKEAKILERLENSPLRIFQVQEDEALKNSPAKEIYRGSVIE